MNLIVIESIFIRLSRFLTFYSIFRQFGIKPRAWCRLS